jgi:hypothetical protein
VKHGAKLAVVNFYNDKVGNPNVPKRFEQKIVAELQSASK